MMRLPKDFKEFLSLLNATGVDYLLVGGYAVAWHGYPRATGDLDVWVAVSADNARRLVTALKQFGFNTPQLCPDIFLDPNKVIRMGYPPFRIEIITSASGCRFEECRGRVVRAVIDDVPVPVIHLNDLKVNKQAAGRLKDLNDLENLP